MTVPETMLTSSGTRHKVGRDRAQTGFLFADCNRFIDASARRQEFYKHRRDCKRCFGDPTIPTFEAGELEQLRASLESARGIAATLEAENARLIEALQKIASLESLDSGPYCCTSYKDSPRDEWCGSCLAAAALPSPHGENNE